MTMMALSEHILAVAHENNLSVTNLQLQKVMYFSFQDGLKDNLVEKTVLEENYDEPFQVWKYGPVVKTVYEKFNIYSGNPIIDEGRINPIFNRLNNTILDLLEISPFTLVNKSHNETFWEVNKHSISGWRSNIDYKIEDILSGIN